LSDDLKTEPIADGVCKIADAVERDSRNRTFGNSPISSTRVTSFAGRRQALAARLPVDDLCGRSRDRSLGPRRFGMPAWPSGTSPANLGATRWSPLTESPMRMWCAR
jgi:hypothetical protein